MDGVMSTHNAGHAPQEHTTQVGKVTTALDIKLQHQFPLPAQAPSSKKPKAAKRTTAVPKDSSKKQKPVQTDKSQSTRGNSTQTPASKIHLHAKPQVRAKQARVLRTTQALLQTLEQVPALTLTEVQSGERGKRKATAKPSSQPKRKPSAVKPTTAGKSRNKEQSQQDSQEHGKQPAIPASKTRQLAQPALTKKRKAAVLTSAVKKATPSKTRVQTRTARPSKVSGS